MNILDIAEVAHEINKAFCESVGDNTQLSWDQAPSWQKSGAKAGVIFHLENPSATPNQSHDNWRKDKELDGWVYGPIKDEHKKEHPCMVDYEQLPQIQRSKDYLFKAVIHSLKKYLED